MSGRLFSLRVNARPLEPRPQAGRRASRAPFLLLLAMAALLLLAAPWRGPRGAQALPLLQGWNLIAAPGSSVSTGTAYTFQENDTAYETVPQGTPLVPGLGYWVPASGLAAVPLEAGQQHAAIVAPAGQWVMIGDPSGIYPAIVSNADQLLSYDPVNGYQLLPQPLLAPGEGAFAISLAGGKIDLDVQSSGSAAVCNTEDTGSACPAGNACPQGYPVAVTNDALAHRAPLPGDPPVTGTLVLCFNDISEALAAGYQQAPATRLDAAGPATAITSDIGVTVLSASLETPAAFMARLQSAGDELCGGCDISGATAILTVQYALENINRPPTFVSTGYFVSEHLPTETSASYFLDSSSEFPIDPVHNGSPTAGTVSAVFSHAAFSDIDTVDWRLDSPLIDISNGITQPHGPNLEFAIHFRGPVAGHVEAYGAGSAPLQPYVPNGESLAPPVVVPVTTAPLPAAPAPVLVPVSTPAPVIVPVGGATTVGAPYTGPGTTTAPGVVPSAPYTP